MEKIKVFKDGDSICVQHPQEPGKPIWLDEYFQVRGGITWPGATQPGYFCLFGLAKHRPTLSGRNPLVLLTEGESPMLGSFFDKLIYAGKKFFSDRFYADLSENGKGFEDALRRHIRDRKAEGIRVRDSSEFDSLEMAISIIKQSVRDNALEVGEGTILYDQLVVMTPDALKGNNHPIHAVEALARVVMSFEVYPFRKERAGGSGFLNWAGRQKTETGKARTHVRV